MKEMNTGPDKRFCPRLKQTFHRRMGGTTYQVHVRFKEQAEPMEDKVLRMVRNDANANANSGVAHSAGGVNAGKFQAIRTNSIRTNTGESPKNHFQNELVCDMMTLPQMSRSA